MSILQNLQKKWQEKNQICIIPVSYTHLKNIEKLAKSDNYSKKELIEEVKANKYFRGLLNEELINKIIQKLENFSEI